MRWWPALLVIAACRFDPNPAPNTGIDAPDNGLPDVSAELGCMTFSSQLDTCVTAFGGPVLLGGSNHVYKYDTTGSGKLEQCDDQGDNCTTMTEPPHGPVNGIDMWLVDSFTLGQSNSLEVSGPVPFGIAANHDVTISGTISLIGGAGNRNAATCGSGAGATGGGGTGAGGGGGGGFQHPGGAGGTGSGANAGGPGVSVGLLATEVRGGCPGGSGGTGSGGSGGDGGGAIYIVSGTMIGLTSGAKINAGGEAGKGGKQNTTAAGGGGGGSGGMIWLESIVIAIPSGTVLGANGGGGGEGSDSNNDGNDGSDGASSAAQAPGGRQKASNGGDGGAGDAGSVLTADVGQSQTSGGGGGGGVGYIKLTGVSTFGGTVSPLPSL